MKANNLQRTDQGGTGPFLALLPGRLYKQNAICSKKGFDYYPFGSLQPGRSGGTHRYGFNGMEKDDELKGSGNSYDFGARMYDARLGRFLSLDPKALHFPWQSPFVFAANNPIAFIDYKGESPGDPSPPGHTGLAGLYITKTIIYVHGVEVPAQLNRETGETYTKSEVAIKGDITKSTRVSVVTRTVVYHTKKSQEIMNRSLSAIRMTLLSP